jgi:hypothetical protein
MSDLLDDALSPSTCANCQFWVRNKADSPLGTCHRHAISGTNWPGTTADEWCGDHELRRDWING